MGKKKNLSRLYGPYPHKEQMSELVLKGEEVAQNVKCKGRSGKYAGKI